MCGVLGQGWSNGGKGNALGGKKATSIGQYMPGAVGQFYQQKEAERETKKAIKKQKAAEIAAQKEESMMFGAERLKRMQGSRSGSLVGGYDSTLTPPAG